MALYFAAQEGEQGSEDDDDYEHEQEASRPSAAPAPAQPTTSSSSQPARKPPTQRPKQMTMDELRKQAEEREEDSEDDKPQDMFAGGEKSGLAVQNPGQSGGPVNHFKNIMKQAQQNRDRPTVAGEDPDEPQRNRNFAGRAQTLGGDDAPSEVIEDPRAALPTRGQDLPRVSRTLHLWADGVSIDDGPLHRFDDPANQGIMAEINRGRAPLALLNVQPNQEVDLNLEPHKDENYVQPPKKYVPFGGQGQRLGAPTPGIASSASTTTQQPSTSTPQAGGSGQVEVDESQPVVQLQIRLGDGGTLRSRFNTTHTIGDVYDFVNHSSPASTQRAYALMTTFPSKELNDKTLVLGDMSDYKRGGVMVQKWT